MKRAAMIVAALAMFASAVSPAMAQWYGYHHHHYRAYTNPYVNPYNTYNYNYNNVPYGYYRGRHLGWYNNPNRWYGSRGYSRWW